MEAAHNNTVDDAEERLRKEILLETGNLVLEHVKLDCLLEKHGLNPVKYLERAKRLTKQGVPDSHASQEMIQAKQDRLAGLMQQGDETALDWLVRDPDDYIIIHRTDKQAQAREVYSPSVLQDILEKNLFSADKSMVYVFQVLYTARKHLNAELVEGRYDFALEPIVERFGEKAAMTTVKLMPEMFSAQVQEKYLGE